MAAILGIAAVMWLVAPIALESSAQEDALITVRYSRNFAAGLGLVFNDGDRVLGTTTPGWALATAWIHLIPVTEPVAIRLLQLLAAVCLVAAVWLVSRWLQLRPRPTVLLWTSVALMPALAHIGNAGMETGAVILVTVLLFRELDASGLQASRWRRVGLACALLALRLDSVFIVAALWGAVILKSWRARNAPRRLLAASAADAAWVVVFTMAMLGAFSLYYGRALPQSMLAKAGSESFDPGIASGLLRWPEVARALAGLDFPWPRASKPFSPGIFWPLLWIVAGAFVMQWSAPDAPERLLLKASVLYLVAYSTFFVLGAAGVYPWYAHAPSFLLTMAVVGSLARNARRPGAKLLMAMLLAGMAAMGALSSSGRFRVDPLHAALREVGEKLMARKAESVMLEPIGYVGYYARDSRIYDLAGLVSPEVLAFRRGRVPGWFSQAVQRLLPQYVVLRHGEVELNLGWNVGVLFASDAQAAWWRQNYVLLEVVGSGVGRLPRLDLFGRKAAISTIPGVRSPSPEPEDPRSG